MSSTAVNPERAMTGHGPAAAPTTEQVWRTLAEASFAVVSYVTPRGDPRSSGVVYTVVGRRLFVVVADTSWKARHIAAAGRVAVTVPVRRGGVMSLVAPIPPATITFHGPAFVHEAGSPVAQAALSALAHLLPAERRAAGRVVEIHPEGRFLTYGVGVPLTRLRSPSLAQAHVPVS